jgi:uncharacterized protein YecT (DUF1311 family)
MANRDRVAEILAIKSRGQRHVELVQYDFRALQNRWNDFPQKDLETAAYFPIRAVTLLEVFTRAWIATLVDSGEPYLGRGIAFAKKLDVKPDYEVVRGIQGRTITLGDVIAHSASLNSFGQMAAAFEALIDEALVLRISSAVDRWNGEEPGKPIISDPEAMASALDRLFRIRHIIVHENPMHGVCAVEDITAMLKAAADFASAANEAFTEILYGKLPLSNVEMKQAAHDEWQKVDGELSRVLEQIAARQDEEGKSLLDDAQSRWVAYRDAQCSFRADSVRGGTMLGLLWLYEARDLTGARLKQMNWYIEREEGDL